MAEKLAKISYSLAGISWEVLKPALIMLAIFFILLLAIVESFTVLDSLLSFV